jgi:hypothetical protein
MGQGAISVLLRNKLFSVDASLLGERMKLRGRGRIDGEFPWNADVILQPGRYDFLVSSFLREVPEDLQLNLEGKASLRGDRKNFSGSASIEHLALSLFGQTFSNASGMEITAANRKITFERVSLSSGTASFLVGGMLEIGKEYDLMMRGSSSLSPLKALSKKIGYLKGDTDFSVSVKGAWDKPAMDGSMRLADASFGLKEFPFYITSVNGRLHLDGEKLILEGLTGKVGGGDVGLTGGVDLRAFRVKKIYLSARLEDITAPLSEDFRIGFGGNLLCTGTPEALRVSGDIEIHRAKYREPVEWRSWLLSAKSAEKPKAEGSLFEKTELNVRIAGSENIAIDNNIARAPVRIRGDMIVKGTVASPILFGRLNRTTGMYISETMNSGSSTRASILPILTGYGLQSILRRRRSSRDMI